MIFSDTTFEVYEVDGYVQQLYCERLLLFSKYFLEEKRVADRLFSQMTQVSSFRFYVLTRESPHGDRMLRYFSIMSVQRLVPAAILTVLS